MKTLNFIVLLASCLTFTLKAEELPKELYMPNDAGGFIVITVEDCTFEYAKKEFPNRAYATEITDDGEIIHEGCWMTEVPPDSRYIPLFNIFFEPNIVASFPHKDFSPEKKRHPEFNPEDLI